MGKYNINEPASSNAANEKQMNLTTSTTITTNTTTSTENTQQGSNLANLLKQKRRILYYCKKDIKETKTMVQEIDGNIKLNIPQDIKD